MYKSILVPVDLAEAEPAWGPGAEARVADLAVRLHKVRGPRLAVNPARIDGGGPNNVVPALAVLRVNVRPADAAAIARVEAAIPVHVGAEADGGTVGEHLDHAAEGLALLAGRVDLGDQPRQQLGMAAQPLHSPGQ